MATLTAVQASLEQLVDAACVNLTSLAPDTYGQPLTVRAGIGWPSSKALQDNVRKGNNQGVNPTALVTIYDRGLATDSTRWLPQIIAETAAPPATVTTLLSSSILPPLGSVMLTFGGVVSVGDAAGVVFIPPPFAYDSFGVVPIAVSGDTPGSMAAKTADLINTSSDLGTHIASSMVTAASSGGAVMITSKQNVAMKIEVRTGTNGTRTTELGRRQRHFQIVVWARTADDRGVIGDQLEIAIARAEQDFGLTFLDGTMGRMTFYGDQEHDEAVLSDTYRRDFLACVEYGITSTDTVYSVLAPIFQYRVL